MMSSAVAFQANGFGVAVSMLGPGDDRVAFGDAAERAAA
jgi:hypothetical protein